MKKILSLILVLVMALSLFAACSSDTDSKKETKDDKKASETTPKQDAPSENEDTNPADQTEDNETNDNETKENEEATPVFKTVEEGKLIMATNAFFAPYEFYQDGEIVGIDVEIARAIAEKLGLELVVENMEFNSIITAVTTGSADFGLAGMTITEDRLKEVDFSISYASGVQVVIVEDGSAITSAGDLTGTDYKIGVQLGTTGDVYACDEFGAERVTQYSNGDEAILALQNGDIDCIIIDNEPAKNLVDRNEGLTILKTTYVEEDYAACFAQDNDALCEAVNQAIKELIIDGTIDAIIEKYIPAN